MRELLERWAKAEPERCRVENAGAHITRPDAFRISWPLLDIDPLNRAVILAAAIEAIEARGWEWSLWGDGNEVSGDITIRDDDTNLGKVHGSGLKQLSTPAEALLTAYLAALEAQA